MNKTLREKAQNLYWNEIVPHMNVNTDHVCKFKFDWEHIAQALADERAQALEEAARECESTFMADDECNACGHIPQSLISGSIRSLKSKEPSEKKD